MLQFIMERNLLLYVLAGACAVGMISQMILKNIYERMIGDTRKAGETEGRFLQQLRQRFQYCAHLNERVGDVRALIQRSLIEYRFWGMSLHQWNRIGGLCLVISLLCAFAGAAKHVQAGGAVIAGNTYLWLGVGAAALLAAAHGLADIRYSRESLEIRLVDYLENSGAVRNYGAAADAGYEELYQEKKKNVPAEVRTPIVSVVTAAESRKAKRRAKAETAAAQSRAQKEKNDLKESLAKMKAGIQETAAERERSKEQNVEILKQMDPKEQERILREVLKEFLS